MKNSTSETGPSYNVLNFLIPDLKSALHAVLKSQGNKSCILEQWKEPIDLPDIFNSMEKIQVIIDIVENKIYCPCNFHIMRIFRFSLC